jgi:hypothetical protein
MKKKCFIIENFFGGGGGGVFSCMKTPSGFRFDPFCRHLYTCAIFSCAQHMLQDIFTVLKENAAFFETL